MVQRGEKGGERLPLARLDGGGGGNVHIASITFSPQGRAKVEYEKEVYSILDEGESSAYPTVDDRIRALDAICTDMQKELKIWFKR